MDRKTADDGPQDDIDTPEALLAEGEALRRRLRQKVRGLVDAFERLEAPKTLVEVGQCARTVLVIDKVITLFFDGDAQGDTQEGDEMYGDNTGQPDAIDAWRHIVERKLADAAEQKRAGQSPAEPDVDAEALARQLDGAAARARAAGD